MKKNCVTIIFVSTVLAYMIMIPLTAKTNKQAAFDLAHKIQTASNCNDLHNNHNNLEELFDNLFAATMSASPQTLSVLGLLESIGMSNHNAFLDDVSPESIKNACSIKKQFLQQLQKYNPTDYTGDIRTSYDVVEWELHHTAQGEPFLFHDYKITQLTGILSDLTMLMTQFHQLNTAQDVDHYIARLHAIPLHLDQIIRVLQHQEAGGIIAPQCTLEKVITIIKTLTPSDPSKHIFYNYLEQNITAITLVDKDAVLEHVHEILANKIYPAFGKLQDYFYHQSTRQQSCNGVWALPDGDAYYAYMLKHHTTTDLSADEIHELGIQEVARIHEEMRTIFASEGVVDNTRSVGEMMQDLLERKEFFYDQTDEGVAQCIADYLSILQRCRQELYPLFDLKPSSPVSVQAVPLHEQEGAPGAYYHGPSLDGSRPGIFFVNLRDMKEVPKYGMETLAVHEAEPGHHFQIALQKETEMHMIRKISTVTISYNAYIEGWALYTERLAYEQGFYSSSWSKLGHLQDELLRAARLVIDTGIHKKRWTRDQAIEYMMQATGYHRNTVITEVERYFVMPGQACSYKIGQLKILDLRKRAQDALGSKFDIREFHNVVLALGAVPLVILEKAIDEYICQVQSLS